MDNRAWKRVLSNWIAECNLTQHNCFNIEQSDIDVFYQNFVQRHRDGPSESRIQEFIQAYYPGFAISVNEDDTINQEDYVYAYSLLLHFSCVRAPDPWFHKICQKLSEKVQRVIEAFFKAMLECPTIDKEILGQIIADIGKSNNNNNSPLSNDSLNSNGTTNSDTPSTVSDMSSSRLFDSPVKSLSRCNDFAVEQRVQLLSTPKTSLLEQRTRELHGLKAQIETERYEKSLLEIQINENEKLIREYNEDRKRLTKELQATRLEFALESSDSETTQQNSDEQTAIIGKLRREIVQNEQKIFDLSVELDRVRGEKEVKEKQMAAMKAKQKELEDRFNDYVSRISELENDVEMKGHQIETLLNDKQELNQYIAEFRSSVGSGKPDFNASSDCLDSSFPRLSVNSSGSVSSPENLGVSVVDIQFREVKLLNEELNERLSAMQLKTNHLNAKLEDTIQAKIKAFDLQGMGQVMPDSKEGPSESDSTRLEDSLQAFESFVDKLGTIYKAEKTRSKELEADLQKSSSKNAELSANIVQFESEATRLKENLQKSEAENQTLKERCQAIEAKLEELGVMYESLKTQNERNEKSMEKRIKNLSLENAEKFELNQNLKEKCTNLEELNSELEDKLQELSNTLTEQSQQLESQMMSEQVLRGQYNKLSEEYEVSKRELCESNDHIKTLHSQLTGSRMELHQLANEIADLKAQNSLSSEKLQLASYKFDELQEQNAALKKQYDEAEERLIVLAKEKAEVEGYLKADRIKVNSLNSLLQIASDVDGDVKSNLDEITSFVRTMLESYETTKRQVGQLQNENKILENQIKETVSKSSGLSEERNALQEQLQEAQADLLECKEALTERMHLVEETMVALKNEQLIASEYVEKTKFLEEQFLSAEKELVECRNQIQILDSNKLELEDKLASILNDYAANKTEADEHKTEQEQQLKKLSEELAQKEAELSETRSKVKQVEEELRGEKEIREARESALHEVRQQLNELQHKLSEDAENARQLKEEKLAMEEAMQSSESARVKLEEDLSNLRQELEQMVARLEKLSKQNEKYAKDIKSLKNEQMKLEGRLIEANKVLKQLSAQLETELDGKKTLNDRIIVLEQELTKGQQEFAFTTKEHNVLQFEFKIQRDKLESALEEVASLGALKTTQSSEIERLTEQVQSLQGEHVDLTSELEDIRKANERLTVEKAEYANDLAQAYSEKATIIALLDKKAEELKQATEEGAVLRAESQKLAQQNEKNERATLELLMLLVEKRFLTENGKGGNCSTSEEQENCAVCESGHSNLSRLRNGVQQLLQNVSVLEVERRQLSTEKGRLSTELANLKKQYAEAQGFKSDNDKRQKRLHDELKESNEIVRRLEQVNDALAKEVENLRAALSTKEQELNALQLDSKRLEDINKGLVREKERAEMYHKEIQELHQAEVKRLSSMLASKNSELDAVRHNFNETMKQLNDKTDYLCDKLDSDLKEARQENEKYKNLTKDKEIELRETQKILEILKKEQVDLQQLRDDLELQVVNQKKKHVALESELSELNERQQRTVAELHTSKKALDEANEKLSASQARVSELEATVETLDTSLERLQLKQKETSSEVERLRKEKEILVNENNKLTSDLKALQLAHNDIVESTKLLRQQYNEYKANENTSESKIREVLERSQSLERDLLNAQGEKQLLQASLEKSESQNEKLNEENRKLRDSQDNSSKRIEKLALQLGDVQARNSKLERQCDKLEGASKTQLIQIETLGREKEAAVNEVKSLRERLFKLEQQQAQLNNNLKTLEKTNMELTLTKQNLEAFEIDAKSKLSKFDKIREELEHKIYNQNCALSKAEQENVRLTLEIGGLNSQIVLLKQEASACNQKQEETSSAQALILKKTADHCAKLEADLEEAQQENINLKDKLSKVSMSLHMTEDKCKELLHNADFLKNELRSMEKIKLEVQEEYEATKLKLNDYNSLYEKMLIEKQKLVADLKTQVEELRKESSAKDEQIGILKNQMEAMRVDAVDTRMVGKEKLEALKAENEQLRGQIREIETKLEKESGITSQLRQDNQVLHAKYVSTKERLEGLEKECENRIKQNRIEMDGKLEKMKAKMKTLYTEETEKLRRKQEREIVNYKTELDKLRSQNADYERIHGRFKNEMKALQGKVAEYEKQNKFITSKLKQLEESAATTTMRAPPMVVNKKPVAQPSLRKDAITLSTASLPTAPTSGVSTNMRMEDEEGEIFNNTYLADLKSGRMSMGRDICPEELQYRNSLVPPHLKSCYPAQYLLSDLGEDELKDGPHSLDDSMSALLSTTSLSGHNKKVCGMTRYKRPGPPTPSKNGGRLSFGSTVEPAREILKEIHDDNDANPKTPARFHLFSSRFSMGNSSKTEIPKKSVKGVFTPKLKLRRLTMSSSADREVIHGSAITKHLKLADGLCTSTPRKSKIGLMKERICLHVETRQPDCVNAEGAMVTNDVKGNNESMLSELSVIETPPGSRPILTPKVLKLSEPQVRPCGGSKGPRNCSGRQNVSLRKARVSFKKQKYLPAYDNDTESPHSTADELNEDGRRVPRPSLILRNPSFAPIQMQMSHEKRRSNLRKQHKQKKRLERLEKFNSRRKLEPRTSTSTGGEESFKAAPENCTYKLNKELGNNSKSLMVIGGDGSQSELSLAVCEGDDDPYEWDDELVFDVETMFSYTHIVSSSSSRQGKIPKQRGGACDQGFPEFGRTLSRIHHHVLEDGKVSTITGDDNNSKERFEQLLKETASEAPFEIHPLQYPEPCSTTITNYDKHCLQKSQALVRIEKASSAADALSNSNEVVSSTALIPYTHGDLQRNLDSSMPSITSSTSLTSTMTPSQHSSQKTSSLIRERVVYGAQIVYSHRLPNVSTTEVRKSSIYFKHKFSERQLPTSTMVSDAGMPADEAIPKITNQTISIYDLLRMWSRMSIATRLTLFFACFGLVLFLFNLIRIID